MYQTIIEESNVRWWHKAGGVLLIIVSPILASYFLFGDINYHYVGQFVGFYLLIALALTFIIGRTQWVKRTMGKELLYGVIFLVCAGIEMSGEGKYSKDILTKKQTTEVLDQFQHIILAAQTGQEIPEESLADVPEQYRTFFKEIRRRYKLSNDSILEYQESVEDPAFINTLSAVSMAYTEGSPMALLNSKAILLQAKRSSNEYYTGLPVAVEMMELDKSFKDGFLRGFNKSKARVEPAMNHYFEIEEQILDTLIDMHELCAAADTSYNNKDEMIMFEDAEVLNQYNAYIDQFSALALEESKAMAKVSELSIEMSQNFLEQRKETGI